jgi:hypothetical protein
MNRRSVVIASAVSVVSGLVAGLIACIAYGDFYVPEVMFGTMFGAGFFAASAVVVLLARLDELKHALLATYIVKISVLTSMGFLLAAFSLHRQTFAVALVVSALAYLACATAMAGSSKPPRRPAP